MKILPFIVFISFGIDSAFGQEIIHLDEKGNKVNETKFRKKWLDSELLLSRWDSIGKDNKRYATLKKDLYMITFFAYQEAKEQVEKIINRQIQENKTILLEYYYTDDLCTSRWDNNWSKIEISERKDFTNPIRKKLEKENIIYLVLYERNMTLHNNPNKKGEYFFIDKNNFFRERIFTNPTMCGSRALIKPNGQTLIRNGEYRADWMAQHLLPENWNLFFETKD
ncbi:hypothetical protein C1T31_03655 [Hanstruepera neustonica]|uniref:Uncharacterized protein n=1 Tax=Hanstruepera neustonica TaxID=1445657 RepID=A0A2K1E4P0_9FLAO|nr:hypothetical protein [Hanstruepera neustonica]PNQ75240.1 hypothetical protein C1T31_03655 [Hanstruepera neustonica]